MAIVLPCSCTTPDRLVNGSCEPALTLVWRKAGYLMRRANSLANCSISAWVSVRVPLLVRL